MQYLLEISESLKQWNTSFECITDKMSHIELPDKEKVFLTGIHIGFSNSYIYKSETAFNFFTFLVINIFWLE